MEVKAAVCAVLLCGLFVCTLGETHSLCYLYTVQSKSSPGRGHGFSVVTLLDDEQIDSYNSISTETGGTRTPKQDWLRKMKESEWKESTDKMNSAGLELNNILKIQMKVFRHEESDGHTLQWRIGCEGGERSDGSVSVINYINEYGYDGEDFISYNWALKKWSASVNQAKEMEEWNGGKGQNLDQKHEECEAWLKIYLQYKPPDIRLLSPGVQVFVKKPETSSTKLTLTCLATGFYPKDVVVSLRKFTTSLPEHLQTSSGVRPNEDGTYQLRKSVEIQEDHLADYDCYVNHISLYRPVITKLGGESTNGQSGGVNVGLTVGVIVVVVVILAAVGMVIYIRWRTCPSGGFRPRNLRVVKTTLRSVEVQWEKPCGKINRYILSVSPSQTDGPDKRQIEVSPGEYSAVIDDLEPGSVYIISLVAVKGSTQSLPVTVKATTDLDLYRPFYRGLRRRKSLSPPLNLSSPDLGTLLGLRRRRARPDTDNDSGTDSAADYVSDAGSDLDFSAPPQPSPPDLGTLLDLDLYPPPQPRPFYRVIFKPRNLKVVKTTLRSVEVQWEKPLRMIDRYILSVSPSQTDGPDKRQIEVSPGEYSAVIDDLEPGSVYIISLVAEKGSTQSLPVTVKATTESLSPPE